jgi:signal recognition particle subunit SRP72
LVEKKKPGREDMEAFETAYNAACGSIARGEFGQGEVLLKRARDLCSAVEDMSDDEKEAELLPILVQQIYVLSRLGRSQEAKALAKDLDVSKVSDASTRHIAKVNEVASTPSENPYLTQRLIANGLESLKVDYPFRFQSAILKRNAYASGLQGLKFSGTASSTHETLAKQTSPTTDSSLTSLAVINAAAHAKCETGKDALKHILPVLERRPTDVGLALTIAHLYILNGNSGAASALLGTVLTRLEQTAPNVRFAPGLVGTVVSLYDSQGQKGPARTELARAARHWRSSSSEKPSGVVHLFKAAGSALLDSQEQKHLDLAREIFQELNSRDPNDRYAAAGLLAAAPEKASRDQLAALQPIERLISGIDVDALENAGIAQAPSTGAPTSRKRPAEDTKPKKAKKIRKNRIPKDYDPSKTPDPERWLPLKDRSTYRPKGKKAKARALLSQGAAVTNDSDGSRPATPGAEVLKQKQAGGGGANKKKKGKGGKW